MRSPNSVQVVESISGSVVPFYRTQVYLGSDLWVRVSLTPRRFASYTSYTIHTSYTSYTIHTGYTSYTSYRLFTRYKLFTSYRLYTEKVTVSSGAIWWPNLELMQVVPSGGQIWN